MDNYLTLIEEGFFYNNTLGRAVELAQTGLYSTSQLRVALHEGLLREREKYKRWVSSDFSWEINLDEAKRALEALSQGKPFSYKGVQVNLPASQI